jgi:hypothetical protein
MQVLHPCGPNSTIVELLVLARSGEAVEARRWRLERTLDSQTCAGKVSGDDTEVLRRCQDGAVVRAVRLSNIDRGQAAGNTGEKRDEYALRSFYGEWRRYMGDVPGGTA